MPFLAKPIRAAARGFAGTYLQGGTIQQNMYGTPNYPIGIFNLGSYDLQAIQRPQQRVGLRFVEIAPRLFFRTRGRHYHAGRSIGILGNGNHDAELQLSNVVYPAFAQVMGRPLDYRTHDLSPRLRQRQVFHQVGEHGQSSFMPPGSMPLLS